jgi:glutaconate CoA-transferase subunit B
MSFARMLLRAAAEIPDGGTVFVGFHWPMLVARVARRVYGRRFLEVYENGVVVDRLSEEVPTSPCDFRFMDSAVAALGSMEALYLALGRGRCDLAILDAPIVDRHGNVDSTCVGPYRRPRVRLAGSGGAAELGALGRTLLVTSNREARSYPAQVPFVTTPGLVVGDSAREELGYPPGTGPVGLVTPLGMLRPDGARRDLLLTERFAGVTPADVAATFGWPAVGRWEDVSVWPEPDAETLALVDDELARARDNFYRLPEEVVG